MAKDPYEKGYQEERARAKREQQWAGIDSTLNALRQAPARARARREAGGPTLVGPPAPPSARGGGGGESPPPQRIIVQQQPAFTGPPIPPIKIAGQPLPGAANAVFILGFGLAAVALYKPFIRPLTIRAWTGKPEPMLVVGTIVGLVGFVLVLVFLASLSPEMAQVSLYLMLALWAVFLVMNPQVMQTVLSWITAGHLTATEQTIPKSVSPAPSAPTGGQGGGTKQ